MKTSDTINELAAALSKAQACMGPAIKGAKNPHFRSSYAEPIMKSIPGLIIGLGLFLGGLYRMEGRRRAVEDERKERTGKEAGP